MDRCGVPPQVVAPSLAGVADDQAAFRMTGVMIRIRSCWGARRSEGGYTTMARPRTIGKPTESPPSGAAGSSWDVPR